jgi:hypothetical protein
VQTSPSETAHSGEKRMLGHGLLLSVFFTLAAADQARSELPPPEPTPKAQEVRLEQVEKLIAESRQVQNTEIDAKISALQAQITQLVLSFTSALNGVYSLNSFIDNSGDVISRHKYLLV